jgi:H+/Cl- antiporter ClcA
MAKVSEQTVLITSIVKWVFLAVVIGVIVGLTTTVFIKLLDFSIIKFQENPLFLFFIPIVFFINAFLIHYLWPKDNADTTDKVIEYIHKDKHISWRSGLKAFFLPILTIAGGGSAGKEAPAADVGAAVGSALSKFLKFDKRDMRKLMICGVSGGFAAVFGTPIAGAIFGVELLFIGGLMYEVLLPSFISGIVAYQVSNALGITYFSKLTFSPVFTNSFFLEIMLAGIFFGLVSFIIIESFKFSKNYSNNMKIWPPFKGLLAGVVVMIMALLFSTTYLGLGLDTVEGVLGGLQIVWYAFLLKLFLTVITLNFGGSGGSITPVLFIGATSGVAFAAIFGFDTSTFVAIGFIAVLAGTANTPIAASIMAIELFGTGLGAYAAVAAVIAFLVTGYRSLYPSQKLNISKSPSFRVVGGTKNISDVRVQIKPKRRGALKYVIKAVEHRDKIRKKIRKHRKKLKEEIIKNS